jgi:hypothetical protein
MDDAALTLGWWVLPDGDQICANSRVHLRKNTNSLSPWHGRLRPCYPPVYPQHIELTEGDYPDMLCLVGAYLRPTVGSA